MFTREELTVVAQVAVKHDLLVISDEVYEHLTFDGHEHLPICTLEGMTGRTLTVGSAGKTFSLTGWKVGWISGPADLIEAVTAVKQFLSFVSGAPFQPAIAAGLLQPREAFESRAADLGRRREILREGLTRAGMTVLGPGGTAQAGYFLVADLAPMGVEDAAQYAPEMAREAGVVAIPMDSFHQDPGVARTLMRFAHCKREETLRAASERLRTAR